MYDPRERERAERLDKEIARARMLQQTRLNRSSAEAHEAELREQLAKLDPDAPSATRDASTKAVRHAAQEAVAAAAEWIERHFPQSWERDLLLEGIRKTDSQIPSPSSGAPKRSYL